MWYRGFNYIHLPYRHYGKVSWWPEHPIHIKPFWSVGKAGIWLHKQEEGRLLIQLKTNKQWRYKVLGKKKYRLKIELPQQMYSASAFKKRNQQISAGGLKGSKLIMHVGSTFFCGSHSSDTAIQHNSWGYLSDYWQHITSILLNEIPYHVRSLSLRLFWGMETSQ